MPGFYSSNKSLTTPHCYNGNCKHMCSALLPSTVSQAAALCRGAGHRRDLECSLDSQSHCRSQPSVIKQKHMYHISQGKKRGAPHSSVWYLLCPGTNTAHPEAQGGGGHFLHHHAYFNNPGAHRMQKSVTDKKETALKSLGEGFPEKGYLWKTPCCVELMPFCASLPPAFVTGTWLIYPFTPCHPDAQNQWGGG